MNAALAGSSAILRLLAIQVCGEITKLSWVGWELRQVPCSPGTMLARNHALLSLATIGVYVAKGVQK